MSTSILMSSRLMSSEQRHTIEFEPLCSVFNGSAAYSTTIEPVMVVGSASRKIDVTLF